MPSDFRTPPNIPVLLEVLHRHQVQFVVFGSGGAVAWGAQLTPGDLDVCPALDEDNLRRLVAVLQEVDARPRHIPNWNTLEDVERWRPEPLTEAQLDHLFETRFGDLDIVPRPYGPSGADDRFDFAALDARATTTSALGMPVRVAGLEDLVASKMSRRRPKDIAALPELERVLALARAAAESDA